MLFSIVLHKFQSPQNLSISVLFHRSRSDILGDGEKD